MSRGAEGFAPRNGRGEGTGDARRAAVHDLGVAVLPRVGAELPARDGDRPAGMTIVYPPTGKWREDVHLELTAEARRDDVVARTDAAVAPARVARPREVRPVVAVARRRRQLDVGARAVAHAGGASCRACGPASAPDGG